MSDFQEREALAQALSAVAAVFTRAVHLVRTSTPEAFLGHIIPALEGVMTSVPALLAECRLARSELEKENVN